MSADNYYMLRRHPKGGFACVMGFMSDDAEPNADENSQQFETIEEAVVWYGQLEDGSFFAVAEYGLHIHSEVYKKPRRAVQVMSTADQRRARSAQKTASNQQLAVTARYLKEKGMSNVSIAKELNLSETSVRRLLQPKEK
jgi:hypothetical protein